MADAISEKECPKVIYCLPQYLIGLTVANVSDCASGRWISPEGLTRGGLDRGVATIRLRYYLHEFTAKQHTTSIVWSISG